MHGHLQQFKAEQRLTKLDFEGYYRHLLENFYFQFEQLGIDLTRTPLHPKLQELAQAKTDIGSIGKPERQNEELLSSIESNFAFMERVDPRKHRDILSEAEYKKLVHWLYEYFDNDLVVPQIKDPIKKVHTAKGNIIWAFRTLFHELHPNYTMPESLFQLYASCFHQFRDDRFENFRKQRKPQYFDSL